MVKYNYNVGMGDLTMIPWEFLWWVGDGKIHHETIIIFMVNHQSPTPPQEFSRSHDEIVTSYPIMRFFMVSWWNYPTPTHPWEFSWSHCEIIHLLPHHEKFHGLMVNFLPPTLLWEISWSHNEIDQTLPHHENYHGLMEKLPTLTLP